MSGRLTSVIRARSTPPNYPSVNNLRKEQSCYMTILVSAMMKNGLRLYSKRVPTQNSSQSNTSLTLSLNLLLLTNQVTSKVHQAYEQIMIEPSLSTQFQMRIIQVMRATTGRITNEDTQHTLWEVQIDQILNLGHLKERPITKLKNPKS